MMRKCGNCGYSISSQDIYCTFCGKKLDTPLYCDQCGAKNDKTAVFCTSCGYALQIEEKPEPPQNVKPKTASFAGTRLDSILLVVFILSLLAGLILTGISAYEAGWLPRRTAAAAVLQAGSLPMQSESLTVTAIQSSAQLQTELDTLTQAEQIALNRRLTDFSQMYHRFDSSISVSHSSRTDLLDYLYFSLYTMYRNGDTPPFESVTNEDVSFLDDNPYGYIAIREEDMKQLAAAFYDGFSLDTPVTDEEARIYYADGVYYLSGVSGVPETTVAITNKYVPLDDNLYEVHFTLYYYYDEDLSYGAAAPDDAFAASPAEAMNRSAIYMNEIDFIALLRKADGEYLLNSLYHREDYLLEKNADRKDAPWALAYYEVLQDLDSAHTSIDIFEVTLQDLDFDGIPELYFSTYVGAHTYLSDVTVYAYRNGQLDVIRSNEGELYGEGPQQLYRNTETGEYRWFNGAYNFDFSGLSEDEDYTLYFYEVSLTDTEYIRTQVAYHAFNSPWYFFGEEIDKAQLIRELESYTNWEPVQHDTSTLRDIYDDSSQGIYNGRFYPNFESSSNEKIYEQEIWRFLMAYDDPLENNTGPHYSYPECEKDETLYTAIVKDMEALDISGKVIRIYDMGGGFYYAVIDSEDGRQYVLVQSIKKAGAVSYRLIEQHDAPEPEDILQWYVNDFTSTSNIDIDYDLVSSFSELEECLQYTQSLFQEIIGEQPNDIAKRELTAYIEYIVMTLTAIHVIPQQNQLTITNKPLEAGVNEAYALLSELLEILKEESITLNKNIDVVIRVDGQDFDSSTPMLVTFDEMPELNGADLLILLGDNQHCVRFTENTLNALLLEYHSFSIQIAQIEKDVYRINYLDEAGEVIEKACESVTIYLPVPSDSCTVLVSYSEGSDNWGGQYDEENEAILFQTPYSGQYEIIENKQEISDISFLSEDHQSAIHFMVSKGFFTLVDCKMKLNT